MKIIANVENKTLRILENERSIFRGEYGADKLELYINKQLENEYPTITALLSNGRKIGPYSTDDAYITEEIDGEQYTKATFTLSKENGFTLSEGKMQITIWMNTISGSKQALGNVILNVINTTAFDDGDIIISGDVEGTIVNIKVELENLQGQVNGFNATLNNLQTKTNLLDDRITYTEQYKADKSEIPTKVSDLEQDIGVISLGEIGDPNDVNNEILNAVTDSGVYTFTSTESYSGGYYVNTNVYFMVVERTDTDGRAVEQFIYSCDVPRDHTSTLSNLTIIRRIKSKTSGIWTVKSIVIPSQEYVDKKIAKLISEEVDSSPETLNTLKELADALKENEDVVEALNSAIGNKANKDEIPTKLSQLEQDVELGVNEEDVMEIVENNSQEVETIRIGTSDNYDITSDNEIPTTKAVASMIGAGGSGGDSVKVADMIVNVNDDMGTVSLSIENCPSIDFYKSFRIEIYENKKLKVTWLFKGNFEYIDGYAYNDLICSYIDNDTYAFDINTIVSYINSEDKKIFGCCLYNTPIENSCEIYYYLSYLETILNINNTFTAKIYYHEANETTLVYAKEY